MSLFITYECINRDVRRRECSNGAIIQSEDIYEINIQLCTEYIGYF